MDKWDKIKKRDLKSLGEAPAEASRNIQAPELAPKDNRFTGRTKRIAFTCRPEFAEELRKLAFEKDCYQIEILERAMEVYKKSLFSSSEVKRNEVKPQIKAHNVNLSVDNYQNNEQIINSCSFRGEEDKGVIVAYCGKPLFDKKKQLCRSHNRQVWKRFNEFTKDKSVSSTAAWLGTWQESGDWEYFWNLEKKEEEAEKPKKPQPKLTPYKLNAFECDKCGDEYEQDTAYSYAPNLEQINNYKTYCSNCVR